MYIDVCYPHCLCIHLETPSSFPTNLEHLQNPTKTPFPHPLLPPVHHPRQFDPLLPKELREDGVAQARGAEGHALAAEAAAAAEVVASGHHPSKRW